MLLLSHKHITKHSGIACAVTLLGSGNTVAIQPELRKAWMEHFYNLDPSGGSRGVKM